MNLQTVNISEKYGIAGNATLECWCHTNNSEINSKPRSALIVVAGGGYSAVSEREREPVAVEFYNRNYNVFMLKYSVAPQKIYPTVIQQLAASIDYVKKNADSLGVKRDAVFAVGFSAGGHLVGSVANAMGVKPDYLKEFDYGLRGVCLSYPVMDEYTHGGSFNNLFSGNQAEMLKGKDGWLNLCSSVSKSNPPAFIWHTATDAVVDPRGSITYALKLAELKIPYELHVFREGAHGLSVMSEIVNGGDSARELNDAKIWLNLADKFFRAQLL